MKLSKAEKLAIKLMKKWDVYSRWDFGFDRAKKRFGCCKIGKRKITLSAHLTKLNEEPEVKDVILHEIAHALDFEDRGTSDHSEKWKRWARKVGADDSQYYDSKKVNNVYKYYDYCPNCGHKRGRHRKRGQNTKVASCGKCSSSFNFDFIVIHNVPATKMEQIEAGEIDWRNLRATELTVQKIKSRFFDTSFEDGLFYKQYSQPVKQVANTETASEDSEETKKPKSNKGQVYIAWKNGEKDANALWEMVGRQVKLSTVKGWLSGWRNDRNLPAIAKSD